MVFARSRAVAAELSERITSKEFQKVYLAVCRGKCEGGCFIDLLYKDAKLGKAFVAQNKRADAKEAELIAEPLAYGDNSGEKTLVKVKLITGRFHQIRAQFASRKMPLVGDKKYGGADIRAQNVALFSHSLDFDIFGTRVEAVAVPDKDKYPWCEFFEYIN